MRECSCACEVGLPFPCSVLSPLLLWASWMGEQPPKPLREVKAFGSHKPRSIELLQKKRGTNPNYAKLFRGSRLCFHPSFSASFFFSYFHHHFWNSWFIYSFILLSSSLFKCTLFIWSLPEVGGVYVLHYQRQVTALHLEAHESRAGRKVSFCVAERDWEG